MIFVTTYKIKPYITPGGRPRNCWRSSPRPVPARAQAHYVTADGSHGVVVADTDDVAGAYANLQNYTQLVEYDTQVMLTVEEAVPLIMKSLG